MTNSTTPTGEAAGLPVHPNADRAELWQASEVEAILKWHEPIIVRLERELAALKAQPVASDVEAIMVLVEAYARAVTLDERVTFEHMGMTAEETAEKAMNAAREALRTALSRALPVADEVRDAARYRWLRNADQPARVVFDENLSYRPSGATCDAAIDSAVAPKGETHE